MTTKDKCYQATVHAGAWKIWPNPVWYPPDGVHEVRFDMKQGSGFHRPIISLKALAVGLDGKLYGVRTMSRPKESGYNMEGRVSIAGKTHSAFTSSKLFERPDGSLVDVAVFVIRGKPKMKCLPAHKGWSIPSAEEVESWADDAAATGNFKKLMKMARHDSDLAGVPGGDLARMALSHRAHAIEMRLKGNIAAASRYEELSDEYIEKYRKARAENPRHRAKRRVKRKVAKKANHTKHESTKKKTSKKKVSHKTVRSIMAKALK